VDEAVLLSDRIVMMTNGPAATIGEELRIELERPRNRVTLADHPEYVRYRQAVLSFLYEKQRFPGKGEDEQDKPTAEAEAASQEDSSPDVDNEHSESPVRRIA
jgi:nitrate/nitrite transport system ATP-binding protein